MFGQMSLFDAPREPFPEEDIDRALCRGGVTENGCNRIVAHFKANEDLQSRVAFLAHEYGSSGSYPAFCCEDKSREFGIDYRSTGIRLWRFTETGREERQIAMSAVAKRIAHLIETGQFTEEDDD